MDGLGSDLGENQSVSDRNLLEMSLRRFNTLILTMVATNHEAQEGRGLKEVTAGHGGLFQTGVCRGKQQECKDVDF